MSAFTQSGTENAMRWDRSSPDFMEVWYSTINHPDTGGGLWLRYTINSPRSGDPYCELWGFYFDPENKRTFAGKQRFSADQLGRERDDGAIVRVGDAWVSETHLEGEVHADGGRRLGWSFDIEPSDRCFQHLPQPLRQRAEHKVSTLCAPNLSIPFTGTVSLDGETLEFERVRGSQSHRWGHAHAQSWAWAHCDSFESHPDAIFEGVAARARFGVVPVPTMTFTYLRYDGRDIEFNSFRNALRAKSRYEMPAWAFSAHNDEFKIVGAARALPERMMQVLYEDPDGSTRCCANSEIADMGIELFRKERGVWRHIDSLTCLRTAHLEFGRMQPFVEVPVAF
ncbi:MAG: tocopherol cyclase family protein [Actinomycetota bacterium]